MYLLHSVPAPTTLVTDFKSGAEIPVGHRSAFSVGKVDVEDSSESRHEGRTSLVEDQVKVDMVFVRGGRLKWIQLWRWEEDAF